MPIVLFWIGMAILIYALGISWLVLLGVFLIMAAVAMLDTW